MSATKNVVRSVSTQKIQRFGDKREWKLIPVTAVDYGESVTDKSYYVPEAEAIRRLHNGTPVQATIDFNGMYDFPADGSTPTADQVKPVPGRKPGLDRTEVAAQVDALAEKVQSDINEKGSAAYRKAVRKKEIDQVTDNLTTPSPADESGTVSNPS